MTLQSKLKPIGQMAACAVQVSLHKLRRLTGLIYPGNNSSCGRNLRCLL